MTINEIQDRNYCSAVKRGQINHKTQACQFANKIDDEVFELKMSLTTSTVNPFDVKELADIALVCFSMAKHFGYDLVNAMEEKTLYNEKRTD